MLLFRRCALGAVLLGLALPACGDRERPGAAATPAPATEKAPPAVPAPPTYVGSDVCMGCHPDQGQRWRGSHHDLALQTADERSVLGDFSGKSVTAFGVTTTFSWKDGRPVVRTDGADGALHDFDVKYTFGVAPLQQYLVETGDGRVQALSWAFDTRPAAEGGQRWFHLHPGEKILPGDPLHWTRVAGNWNNTCAECHSTQVRKGYQPATGSYATSFAEIDVGCEACHGPGSAHVAWTKAGGSETSREAGPAHTGFGFQIGASDGATWVRAPGEAIAHRSIPRSSQAEIETCARCHSRRGVLSEDYVHGHTLLDTHRVAFLDEGLYFADGQIEDEVYEYGSFLASRMYAHGVTCSDCHDPHSLHLREEGNALCGRCHAPEVFDTPKHHHHAEGSVAARCISCHAPTRTYMELDARHDHSFRIPRPDLTVAIGTPNACNGCHPKKSARWAADTVARWRGPGATPRAHFGSALHAGRAGLPNAEGDLAALALDESQPAIARASALRLLGGYLSSRSLPALQQGLTSADPLLRLAAAESAQAIPPPERLALVRPLLRDPVRAIRLEAATSLVNVPPSLWSAGDRNALADALAEYRSAQQVHLDQPEAHLKLGNLHVNLGELDAARAEYETALRIAPYALPAYVNLADLLRLQGRDVEGEALLRQALARAPENADVWHVLGLLLVREKRMGEAVDALGQAATRAPDRTHYAVAHALALQAAGDEARSLKLLEAAHARRPGEREPLAVLVGIHRDRGDVASAQRFARELQHLAPDDPLALEVLSTAAPQKR
jgi:tetratricopeptide (TPR) repeat protein